MQQSIRRKTTIVVVGYVCLVDILVWVKSATHKSWRDLEIVKCFTREMHDKEGHAGRRTKNDERRRKNKDENRKEGPMPAFVFTIGNRPTLVV